MEDSGIDSDSKSNSNDACSTPSKILFLEGQSSAAKDSSSYEEVSKNDEHWHSEKDSALEDLLQKTQHAEETVTNCQPKKSLNSNQLQKRLEKQILEAKKIRQQSKAETTDAQRRSLIPRNRLSVPNKVILTPVVTKADEQPLVTWESDSDDEFDFHPMSRAATKEITQQLKKDGYNLDLTPDDEDLDLIPPKPLNERCTCCHPGYGCIII